MDLRNIEKATVNESMAQVIYAKSKRIEFGG